MSLSYLQREHLREIHAEIEAEDLSPTAEGFCGSLFCALLMLALMCFCMFAESVTSWIRSLVGL